MEISAPDPICVGLGQFWHAPRGSRKAVKIEAAAENETQSQGRAESV